MAAASQFYTIPASYSFGRTLARSLLDREGDGFSFNESLILLPTRRACRTMRDIFLQLGEGRPLLLPRLQPLGDVDEEELALHLAGSAGLQEFLDIPPALSVLRRRILLARLVMGRDDFHGGFDQALKLAEALGRFIDQIYIEELDFQALHSLVPEEFAAHWQITLEFLKILGEHWPSILRDYGVIDAADRRGRLMDSLSCLWTEKPPQGPVIAAGSTGSIPATARLMAVIADLPCGEVILPAYDPGLDEESWEALEATHPQFGFRQLFERTGRAREDVVCWPDILGSAHTGREILAREIMRPARTTSRWMDIRDDLDKRLQIEGACNNLHLIVCDTQREEADVIALAFRELLETPGKTGALITPDRGLARRVAAACTRWGVRVDDSAGQALHYTELGSFLYVLAQAVLQNLEPSSFLDLLRHDYCCAGLEKNIWDRDVSLLERYILRGQKPASGFEGLYERLDMKEEIPKNARECIQSFLRVIEPVLTPLMDLCASGEAQNFGDFLKAHLEAAEQMCRSVDVSGAEKLWSGETGEQAARFLAELSQDMHLMAPLRSDAYVQGLKTLMEGVTVRSSYGMHPRLMILGQLEARLIDADLVVLGSLNEGIWPASTGHDPWMSRPMRTEFGLPLPERGVGLSAHDFVQGFCASRLDGPDQGRVLMTRSKQVHGTPCVPARWLQRLETVLEAGGFSLGILNFDTYRSIVHGLDDVDEILPFSRPAPKPPVSARPQSLSVTKIETWLQDPYQIYARSILNLKPLDPVGQGLDAAYKGSVLHDILERFVMTHPDVLSEGAHTGLLEEARTVLSEGYIPDEEWSFWWPRFDKIAGWFLDQEVQWREEAAPLKMEVRGRLDLTPSLNHGSFSLHGIADRIDRMRDSTAAIIDYKSGGSFSKSGMVSGKTPQLPLEALILQDGGFDDVGASPVSFLSYWVLSGGAEAGKIMTLGGDDVVQAVEMARAGLIQLVTTWQDDSVPYYAQPRSDRLPRFNDYEHLARVKEWSTGGSEEEAV